MKMYWRRFVGWVTALRHKYLADPFFRSEFNVVALQIVFAASLVIVVALYFNHIYSDVSKTIIDGLISSIKNNSAISGEEIINKLSETKNINFLAFILITSIITVIFSYFIAKVTLAPVRNAIKLQKRFISDIAHELRTPLSVIKTNTEVALLNTSIEPKLKATLLSNVEELDRTSDIINNLLSLSNLVEPARINFGTVDLGVVIDTVLEKMKDLAENKKNEIRVKKIGPYTVWGNSTALEQIVSNLIKNAINYTPSNGIVNVKVEPDYQGNTVLSIKDNGVGIENKDLAHVFEPFYRAERSRNRRLGSSGLGLTIVSELVKMHSGRITIKSELNKGTEVVVVLPRNKKGKNEEEKEKNDNEVSVDFLDKRR